MSEIKKRCFWKWEKDLSRGGFIISCDKWFIWQYQKSSVSEDFKFCPNCGKKIVFEHKLD